MGNEYFPNEVCNVAFQIENSSVWPAGRKDSFISSSLLPGMIRLSLMTQDCNNIKVKWWNAEIRGHVKFTKSVLMSQSLLAFLSQFSFNVRLFFFFFF